jgi:nucleoside-diphosphate-sugar epimerase
MKVFVIGIAGFLGSHIAEALLDPAAESGFRPIPVGPAHPGAELFWPVPGRALGFGDGFIIAVRDLLASIAEGCPPPDFVDGLRASEVVAAAWASAVTRSWQAVERLDLAEGRDP